MNPVINVVNKLSRTLTHLSEDVLEARYQKALKRKKLAERFRMVFICSLLLSLGSMIYSGAKGVTLDGLLFGESAFLAIIVIGCIIEPWYSHQKEMSALLSPLSQNLADCEKAFVMTEYPECRAWCAAANSMPRQLRQFDLRALTEMHQHLEQAAAAEKTRFAQEERIKKQQEMCRLLHGQTL